MMFYKSTWNLWRFVSIQSPVIAILNFKELLHEEIFVFLLNCSLLKSDLKTEYQIEQRNMLLFNACYYCWVNTRHYHWMEEFLINCELFILLLLLFPFLLLNIIHSTHLTILIATSAIILVVTIFTLFIFQAK